MGAFAVPMPPPPGRLDRRTYFYGASINAITAFSCFFRENIAHVSQAMPSGSRGEFAPGEAKFMYSPSFVEFKIRFDDLWPEHIDTAYIKSLTLLSERKIQDINRLAHYFLLCYNFNSKLESGVHFAFFEEKLEYEYELIEFDFNDNIKPLGEHLEDVIETTCRIHRGMPVDDLKKYQELKDVIKTARASYLDRLDEQRRRCTQNLFAEFNKLLSSGIVPSKAPEDQPGQA